MLSGKGKQNIADYGRFTVKKREMIVDRRRVKCYYVHMNNCSYDKTISEYGKERRTYGDA